MAIGITGEKSIAVVKYTFDGDRAYNIKAGVKNALFLLYESLVSYKAQKAKRLRLAQQQQQFAAQQQQYAQQQYAPPQDDGFGDVPQGDNDF